MLDRSRKLASPSEAAPAAQFFGKVPLASLAFCRARVGRDELGRRDR